MIFFFVFLTAAGCQNTGNIENPEPYVNPEWAEWIKVNHCPVSSINAADTDFSDLQFLKILLSGRSLVQLGESGHGVSEFNRARVRLIKFFHQELGFEVIAFESPIFECYVANSQAGSDSARNMLVNSIFGIWHCQEVLELFDYIKTTQNTSRPLILAGFDMQVMDSEYSRSRPYILRDVIATIDTSYAQKVYEREKEFISHFLDDDWNQTHAEELKSFYENLFQWFDSHLTELEYASKDRPLLARILRQTAWGMVALMETHRLEEHWAQMNTRDQAMAGNVTALLENIYTSKKMIIWAHNQHIEHDSSMSIHPGFYSMGTHLCENFRARLYSIGMFMYQGQADWPERETYTIDIPGNNTLEAILFKTGCEFALVDMFFQTNQAGCSWMFIEMTARSWGKYPYQLVPRNQYDAIFFTKNVNPPQYIY
jgi:erythromycin esterase